MKEFKGEWFLANNQEIKIPGILTIDDEHFKISLQLFSTHEISPQFNGQLVLGLCALQKITIVNCYARSEEQIPFDFFISDYAPHFVFVGCHFNSLEELNFKSISLRFNYLNHWLEEKRVSSLKLEHQGDDSVVVKYFSRNDITIKLNKDCNLVFQRSCSTNGVYGTELHLKVKHYATFVLEEHRSFKEFLNLTVKLQNILMLCIGKPLSILERIGFSEKAIDLNETNFLKLEQNPIAIYQHSEIENIAKNDFIHFSKFLISFARSSAQEIESLIIKWFEEYEKFEPVYDIFFHAIKPIWRGDSFTMSNVTYNNAFLNIVQALESYHRIKFKKKATLENRIKELLKNKKIFAFLFNNELDIAKNLVKWRDSLTHINHQKSTDIEVINWFNKAQIILIVNLFKDLGIDEEKIKQTISSSRLFPK